MDEDMAFRMAVFNHVQQLRDKFTGLVPREALKRGIVHQGEPVAIWNEGYGTGW